MYNADTTPIQSQYKVISNDTKNDSIKETLDTYSFNTVVLFGKKSVYCHVKFDCKYSTSISLNIRTKRKLYVKMQLNKRYLGGLVEDENGKEIGYVDATLNVTGDSFKINGKLTLESDDYNYQEMRLQVNGKIPQNIVNKLRTEETKDDGNFS